MRRFASWAAFVVASALAACGGGGGSSSTESNTPSADVTPSANIATIALSGVAAKGLMSKALVTAHKVKADGTVDDAVLAGPVLTDDKGAYALSVPTTMGEPYVIKVTATAETTHKDEVTGLDEKLPAGFAMRSVQVAPSTTTATVTASVTPFSEMTVAAAVNAGGLTKTTADQAKLAVIQLLGFDPGAVSVKSADAGDASDNEKKLALLLTAVAQMASSGALGCGTGDSGDKTRCVVETLARSANSATVKLQVNIGTETQDVSAALAAALNVVISDDRLSKGVPASVLTTVAANLGCSGSSCNTASISGGGSGPTALQLAIAEAKLWFSQLTADWNAMFKTGGVNVTTAGTLNLEANKFRAAMKGVEVPADALARDIIAIGWCLDMYYDYKSGRLPGFGGFGVSPFVPQRNGATGTAASSGMSLNEQSALAGVNCSAVQDAAGTRLSSSKDNANFIVVSANFFYERDPASAAVTRWRHAFLLTPTSNGEFSYLARARMTSATSNVTVQTDPADPTKERAPYSGVIGSQTDADGRVTGFSIKGDLPGAFVRGGNAMANDHMVIDVASIRELPADGSTATTLTGTLTSFTDRGVLDSTLKVKSGKLTEQAYIGGIDLPLVRLGSANASAGGSIWLVPSSVVLDVVFTNAGGEFEGIFSATDPVWDQSNSRYTPTKGQIKGALRNVDGGGAKEFLSGEFTVTFTGYSSFVDDYGRTPSGPGNYFVVSAAFVGQVDIPGRPLLEVKFDASRRNYLIDVESASMQYSSVVNGQPRTVVNGSLGAPNFLGQRNLTLTELGSNLSLTRRTDSSTGRLTKGNLVLGDFNNSNGRIDFVDRSFITLSLGL